MLGAVYPERVPDAARLAGLSAWRMAQGIYRYDPAVYEAVRDTPLSGDIPHDVLYRLPEWCVYVETPGLRVEGAAMSGAFVHLEYDFDRREPELRLLLDVDAERGPMLVPIALHLGAWPLAESISRALQIARDNAAGLSHAAELVHQSANWVGEAVEPVVSLTLYLCSQASEIGDGRRRPGNPQPVRTRRNGLRLFPADGPTAWDVGVRLGAALRLAYHAEQAAAGGTHAGPRGHVRRAHWHGYWSGPREGARRYDLRWMPPIPVNLGSLNELPAVVRGVG